jgi:hypothetical protein
VPAVTYTARAAEDRHPLGDVSIAVRLAELRGMPHRIVLYKGADVLDLITWTVTDTDGEAMFLREGIWSEVRSIVGSPYLLIGDECFSGAAGKVARESMLEFLGLRSLGECPTLWPFIRRDRLQEFCDISRAEVDRLLVGSEGRPLNNVLDEALHSHRAFHFSNPKRRMLYRAGMQMRRPLVALDVLDFNRALPLRQRIGKRLVLEAMKARAPDIAALPRARDTETVDYWAYLQAMEKDGGKVASFIFDDNPLLERYFDLAAVRSLVAKLTAVGQAAPRRTLRLADLLPPQHRRVLAAFARKYLHMRSPCLAGASAQLLRIVGVAAVLRHVHRRCGAPESIGS